MNRSLRRFCHFSFIFQRPSWTICARWLSCLSWRATRPFHWLSKQFLFFSLYPSTADFVYDNRGEINAESIFRFVTASRGERQFLVASYAVRAPARDRDSEKREHAPHLSTLVTPHSFIWWIMVIARTPFFPANQTSHLGNQAHRQ